MIPPCSNNLPLKSGGSLLLAGFACSCVYSRFFRIQSLDLKSQLRAISISTLVQYGICRTIIDNPRHITRSKYSQREYFKILPAVILTSISVKYCKFKRPILKTIQITAGYFFTNQLLTRNLRPNYYQHEFKELWLSDNLPEGQIYVAGDLDLSRHNHTKPLPENLYVEGNVNLQNCSSLISLPKNLYVGGELILYGCSNLRYLSEGIRVDDSADLRGCSSLTALPNRIYIKRDLRLNDCTNLKFLPKNLRVGQSLHLIDCTGLTSLPEGLDVGWRLDLEGCTNLKSVPKNMHVRGIGSISLKDCTNLKSLPKNMHVWGSLDLGGCTGLTSLPEGLDVRFGMDLKKCTNLTSLPEGLNVGWGLYLEGCIRLTTLPETLNVGGNLNLKGCRGITSLPNCVTRMGSCADGTIRLVYLEGTNLPDETIHRLLTEPYPGMRFVYINPAYPNTAPSTNVNFGHLLVLQIQHLKNPKRRDIVKAYNRLALKYHPDKVPGKEEMFRKITEAKDLLLEALS